MNQNPLPMFNYKLTAATKSPRRHQLLKEMGLTFEVKIKEVDENFPLSLQAEQIPLYLCNLKADCFDEDIAQNEVILTADTVVWIEGQVLNKPYDYNDAVRMLNLLSGKRHEVYTGVCLKSRDKKVSFFARTDVYFKPLTAQEIDFYITNYKPFDKAGSYGAQDWIGLIGVEKIEGSYFNVMGLPVKELYEQLNAF